MKTLPIITICMLFSCPLFALTNGISQLDGKKFMTTVTSDRLKQSSTWSPKEGEPPISPVKALKITSKSINDNFATFTDYKVKSIDLAQSTSGSWLYKITLFQMPSKEEFEKAGGSLKPDTLVFFVLLNGEVIHPVPRSK